MHAGGAPGTNNSTPRLCRFEQVDVAPALPARPTPCPDARADPSGRRPVTPSVRGARGGARLARVGARRAAQADFREGGCVLRPRFRASRARLCDSAAVLPQACTMNDKAQNVFRNLRDAALTKKEAKKERRAAAERTRLEDEAALAAACASITRFPARPRPLHSPSLNSHRSALPALLPHSRRGVGRGAGARRFGVGRGVGTHCVAAARRRRARSRGRRVPHAPRQAH